jgi:sugar lactone lactonase YvrE
MHDGYILVLDKDDLRCAGTGFCFTNEIRIRDGYLYVAETALGRIVRHSLRRDGTLGPREAFGPDPLYPDARVDGIAFDEGGNLWVTEISRHALVVITPQGEAHTVFENPAAQVIDFPTSITFAGADRRTAIVGSLRMDRLATFEAPFPGARLRHWRTR